MEYRCLRGYRAGCDRRQAIAKLAIIRKRASAMAGMKGVEIGYGRDVDYSCRVLQG
mgnify:CR=1 FL=1